MDYFDTSVNGAINGAVNSAINTTGVFNTTDTFLSTISDVALVGWVYIDIFLTYLRYVYFAHLTWKLFKLPRSPLRTAVVPTVQRNRGKRTNTKTITWTATSDDAWIQDHTQGSGLMFDTVLDFEKDVLLSSFTASGDVVSILGAFLLSFFSVFVSIVFLIFVKVGVLKYTIDFGTALKDFDEFTTEKLGIAYRSRVLFNGWFNKHFYDSYPHLLDQQPLISGN